ncbi:mannan endo-1,4-beta-mannosidase B precursor [Vibrio astriarenae]|nr:mannan endo-1,4-beta-mannosidase B precursor [Vibrio sp. C7]
MNPWSINTVYYTDDVTIDELFDPNTLAYANWRDQMDTVADALTELQEAGVVVLWRPIQEKNYIKYHWWGANGSNSPTFYPKLYRQLYQYLTVDKGLNNLLWIYSPYSQYHSKRDVTLDYPGNDVVDIIGATSYSSDLTFPTYQEYLSFNKPVAMTEYSNGHHITDKDHHNFDTMLYQKGWKKTTQPSHFG